MTDAVVYTTLFSKENLDFPLNVNAPNAELWSILFVAEKIEDEREERRKRKGRMACFLSYFFLPETISADLFPEEGQNRVFIE